MLTYFHYMIFEELHKDRLRAKKKEKKEKKDEKLNEGLREKRIEAGMLWWWWN